MWKKLKIWWNREWFDWNHYEYVNTCSYGGRLLEKHQILKRISNDGLIEYKQIKIY
jgi:hypothetical protein